MNKYYFIALLTVLSGCLRFSANTKVKEPNRWLFYQDETDELETRMRTALLFVGEDTLQAVLFNDYGRTVEEALFVSCENRSEKRGYQLYDTTTTYPCELVERASKNQWVVYSKDGSNPSTITRLPLRPIARENVVAVLNGKALDYDWRDSAGNLWGGLHYNGEYTPAGTEKELFMLSAIQSLNDQYFFVTKAGGCVYQITEIDTLLFRLGLDKLSCLNDTTGPGDLTYIQAITSTDE